MKITVMCGAGAMSTFVAHRLRRACDSAGRNDLVGVSTLKAGVLPGTDLLLLGNHVPRNAAAVLEAQQAGIAVVRLPANIASDTDGQRTLDLVHQAAELSSVVCTTEDHSTDDKGV
ncbi:MAG: PTS sugar transporter subunit IIB [Galactobacter sp.]